MTNEWFYAKDGKQLGPISAAEIRGLATSGEFQPSDLVWRQGMPNWEPAVRIKGLLPSQAVTQPIMPASRAAGFDAGQAKVAARQIGQQAKDVAVAASTDAFKAFKAMAANPVGGLREAFDSLGPSRSMIVGIVFAIVFDLCILVGMWLVTSHYLTHGMRSDFPDAPQRSMTFGMLFKLTILGLVPLVSATAGCAAVRKIFRGQGSIQSDIFIAGASLLPFGVAVLLTGILGGANTEIIALLGVFASTTTILMLYSGCTTLQGIPDAAATLSVPLMILADVYVCKIILASMLA
jgi:hypothetical protein